MHVQRMTHFLREVRAERVLPEVQRGSVFKYYKILHYNIAQYEQTNDVQCSTMNTRDSLST